MSSLEASSVARRFPFHLVSTKLICEWVGLKDRFGVSWQVTPRILPQLMADPDRDKANRVTAAMMEMRKIDVAKLEEAAVG